jgi:hypothetical protein
MSDQFLSLALDVSGGAFCNSDNPYGNAFCNVVINNVLLVVLLCVVYGPLFACVNTPRRLLGHITGLLYLLFFIITFEMYRGFVYGGCEGQIDKEEVAILVMGSTPSYIFYVILLVWFSYEIVNDILVLKIGYGIFPAHGKNAYLFKYTGYLLSKREELARWQQLLSFFWIFEKGFRFPLRFLAPLIVMITINFKLFFEVVYAAYLLSPWTDVFIRSVTDIEKGTVTLAILSGLIAMGMCGVLLLQFVATVHKHLKLAAQGKFKFYRRTLPPHSSILAAALKYGGYQIGYFAWAWLIFWAVALILLVLISSVFVGLKYFPEYVGPKVFQLALTIAWIPIVLLAHKLVCKFAFLESDTGGRFLSVTNRNGFNCFSYFVFLYNGIVGFVAAIFRVLLGLLFGTLLLFRLDQNIMMDHFKFADLGHKIYLGFLYLEHTYNNPVANTFVALLTDGGDQEEKGDRSGLNRHCSKTYGTLSSQKGPGGRNRRIRNRWLVAYTLINNPGLIPLRASQMEAQGEGGAEVKEHYEPIVLIPGIH